MAYNTISGKGIGHLKVLEGVERQAYQDVAGHWTIGAGHMLTKDELSSGKIMINGEPVKWGDGLDYWAVGELLKKDLAWAQRAVNEAVHVPLSQQQFDALVSFTYNVGGRAFRDSTLVELLNEGDYLSVPFQLMRWDKAAGKVHKGLVNRRRNEVYIWCKGELKPKHHHTFLTEQE